MVAGLNTSGAINLLIKDLPKSTASGPNVASKVIGSTLF